MCTLFCGTRVGLFFSGFSLGTPWEQGPTLQGCIGAIRAVLWLYAQLGIQINLSKSDLVPSPRKQYLSMVLDSVRALDFLSLEWVSWFLSVAQTFLEDKASMVSLWRLLLGHLASLKRLVMGSRGHSQPLQ
ncbi:hypothetical protein E2C01_040514 [Portunus trituberculatus]|uniref:Uncharacterized protein n=1 Tax=Portunus trituberculatus TaxID=210409 RepID=A0A5B7FPF0_PORTR|nr:hypothetical protein [Portunus trituberculatus]